MTSVAPNSYHLGYLKEENEAQVKKEKKEVRCQQLKSKTWEGDEAWE